MCTVQIGKYRKTGLNWLRLIKRLKDGRLHYNSFARFLPVFDALLGYVCSDFFIYALIDCNFKELINKPNVTGWVAAILADINFFSSLFVSELVFDAVNFVQMWLETAALREALVAMVAFVWFDAYYWKS